MILETSRLRLRELLDQDIDFIAQLLANPQVMRFWPRPHTRDESIQWIQKQKDRYARHGCGYWLAIEKSTGEPIGQAGVMMVTIDGIEQPSLGWIIDPAHWRRGFAAEAGLACMQWSFRTMSIDQITALVRPENLPSVAVARKLGMKSQSSIIYADFNHFLFLRPRF